jgi:hypothetical protein
LQDVASKGGQRVFEQLIRQRRHRPLEHECPLGVVGVHTGAQPNGGGVRLAPELDEVRQPGRSAEEHWQYAARHRIERAGVADPLLTRQATDSGNHVVRCPAAGFVDIENADQVAAVRGRDARVPLRCCA